MIDYKYDIALSFAGEDRDYVDEVAKILQENKVSVFYDKFEEVDLWGKDLSIHFDYVYRRQSRYFIPFISKNYAEKVWTNYEIRNALARSIENKEEYILPVRFDNTELDGIRSTIGYLDLSKISPEELANKILKKLGSEQNIPIPEKEEPQGKIYLSTFLIISENYGVTGINIGVTATNVIKEHRYFGPPIFKLSKPIEGAIDSFQLMNPMIPIEFPKKLEYGEQYEIQYTLTKGFLEEMGKFRGQDVTLLAYVSTSVGERFESNEMNIDDLFQFEK